MRSVPTNGSAYVPVSIGQRERRSASSPAYGFYTRGERITTAKTTLRGEGRLVQIDIPGFAARAFGGNTIVEPLGRALLQPSLMAGIVPVSFKPESLTGCTNGRGNCPLNSQNVVSMTTAERVGQRLNQDAWDQVRQLIKNLLDDRS